MELLTGFGMATAAGLNAYIPLLALGLLARFTDLVNLPHTWAWLENGWVMGSASTTSPRYHELRPPIPRSSGNLAGRPVIEVG